jgi:hypothetical protein
VATEIALNGIITIDIVEIVVLPPNPAVWHFSGVGNGNRIEYIE